MEKTSLQKMLDSLQTFLFHSSDESDTPDGILHSMNDAFDVVLCAYFLPFLGSLKYFNNSPRSGFTINLVLVNCKREYKYLGLLWKPIHIISKQFETENEPFNVVDNGDVLRFLVGSSAYTIYRI